MPSLSPMKSRRGTGFAALPVPVNRALSRVRHFRARGKVSGSYNVLEIVVGITVLLFFVNLLFFQAGAPKVAKIGVARESFGRHFNGSLDGNNKGQLRREGNPRESLIEGLEEPVASHRDEYTGAISLKTEQNRIADLPEQLHAEKWAYVRKYDIKNEVESVTEAKIEHNTAGSDMVNPLPVATAEMNRKTINGVENVLVSRLSVCSGVDEDNLHGRVGLLPNGTPAWIPLSPLPMANETVEEKEAHHRSFQFNKRRSDGISLDRPIDDYRHPKCLEREVSYPKNLPNTSIVFVFYNEPVSTIYRSLHSVLNRTPRDLLHEIILVDDGSEAEWLNGDFEKYLALLPKTKLVRLPTRDGLMLARKRGAQVATGETITFLDSHIEANVGWLEPLMARIKEDRANVVMPIIDEIEADSFVYKKGGIDILGFSWALDQKSMPPTRHRSEFDPMASPIMAGGLFSIDRSRFFEIGAYDSGQKLYGGEQMEISFRIWQCGGRLECIPCSRVGHVFRSIKFWKGRAFTIPVEVFNRNKLRAAEAWLGEYSRFTKSIIPPLPPGEELGDMSHLLEVKERLKCKPFSWYLENVYPELFVPDDDKYASKLGELRNVGANLCLDALGKKSPGDEIGVYACHGSHGNQEFVYSVHKEIRVGMGDYMTCVDSGGPDGKVIQFDCHGQKGNQLFEYDEDTKQLSQSRGSSNNCLTISTEESGAHTLVMEPCQADQPKQQWVFGDVQ